MKITSYKDTRNSVLIKEVIVIPRYKHDIVVITRVQDEAEYEC